MSQMSTVPVFICKYCNKRVAVTELRTSMPDQDAELLNDFMRNLAKIAQMCPDCRKKRDYWASQGRVEEFYKGATVPIDLDRIVRKAGF